MKKWQKTLIWFWLALIIALILGEGVLKNIYFFLSGGLFTWVIIEYIEEK